MATQNRNGGRLKRYLRRVKKALEGRHARTVFLNIVYTGSAADAWVSLREASAHLPIDDQALSVLALMRSFRKLRNELSDLECEEHL